MLSENKLIHTERLVLRPIVADDLDAVYQGLSHPDIIKYYGVSYHSREATESQMLWYDQLEREGTGQWWAVCSKDLSVFYGAGGLNDLKKEHLRAEIGFWLLPSFWGHGYMSEALPAICAYGFQVMGIHRIEGLVETENINCKQAMARLDFNHEGTLVDVEIKNGKFISLDVFAKINPS